MSRIAAVKAKLGLTSPTHERELREIFDAIAEAHPALAQSDIVQAEVVVRRFQLEKLEAALADFKAGLPKVAKEAVEYEKGEMLRALRIGARSEIEKVGNALRKEMRAGDPAEPARSVGRAAVFMIALLIFGISVGLALRAQFAGVEAWLRLDYAIAALAGAAGSAMLSALVSQIVRTLSR